MEPELDVYTKRPRTPRDQYTNLTDVQIRNIPTVGTSFKIFLPFSGDWNITTTMTRRCTYPFIKYCCIKKIIPLSIYRHCNHLFAERFALFSLHTSIQTSLLPEGRGSFLSWSLHKHYQWAFSTWYIVIAAVWIHWQQIWPLPRARLWHVQRPGVSTMGCQQARFVIEISHSSCMWLSYTLITQVHYDTRVTWYTIIYTIGERTRSHFFGESIDRYTTIDMYRRPATNYADRVVMDCGRPGDGYYTQKNPCTHRWRLSYFLNLNVHISMVAYWLLTNDLQAFVTFV